MIELLAEAVAAHLIERWEGWRSRPYLCPAGVPTIGFGFTYYPDGRTVTLGDAEITREQAAEMLKFFIRTRYMRAVIQLCPGAQTPEQLGALTDFAFNLGNGALKTSTLRQVVNAGRWEDAPAQFRKWVRAGGRVLRGLVLRREAEIAIL